MSKYTLRLNWQIGEHKVHDPPLVPLAATGPDEILEEAETIWADWKDAYEPRPVGYLIYDCASGKLLVERLREEASERECWVAVRADARRLSSPRPFWRGLWPSLGRALLAFRRDLAVPPKRLSGRRDARPLGDFVGLLGRDPKR
jgi:hypothetical protein